MEYRLFNYVLFLIKKTIYVGTQNMPLVRNDMSYLHQNTFVNPRKFILTLSHVKVISN